MRSLFLSALVLGLALTLVAGASAQSSPATAVPIVVNGVNPGSTVGFPAGSQTASCGASSNSPSYWYSYQAGPCPTTALASFCAADGGSATWDTVLVAYLAPIGGALTQVACNDDSCSLQSRITFPITPNARYLIRVAGYSNATGSYSLYFGAPNTSNCLSLAQGGPGVGNLTVTLSSLSATATEGWILPTASLAPSVGGGMFFGINPDASTFLILLNVPVAEGNPFHFPIPSVFGLFPNTPFVAGPGSVTGLAGLTLDFVTVLLRPGLVPDGQSNVVRFSFQ